MRRSFLAFTLSMLGLAFAGCSEPGQECTEYAAFSVTIDVVDTSGGPLPGATVTYQIDGGEVMTADCFAAGDPATCSEFVTLAERTGDFSITVSKEGYQTEQRDVTVVMDEEGCHVVEQQLTVPLTPAG